jgi:hypothetical protein
MGGKSEWDAESLNESEARMSAGKVIITSKSAWPKRKGREAGQPAKSAVSANTKKDN